MIRQGTAKVVDGLPRNETFDWARKPYWSDVAVANFALPDSPAERQASKCQNSGGTQRRRAGHTCIQGSRGRGRCITPRRAAASHPRFEGRWSAWLWTGVCAMNQFLLE
jgi:hypothetical protein